MRQMRASKPCPSEVSPVVERRRQVAVLRPPMKSGRHRAASGFAATRAELPGNIRSYWWPTDSPDEAKIRCSELVFCGHRAKGFQRAQRKRRPPTAAYLSPQLSRLPPRDTPAFRKPSRADLPPRIRAPG